MHTHNTHSALCVCVCMYVGMYEQNINKSFHSFATGNTTSVSFTTWR